MLNLVFAVVGLWSIDGELRIFLSGRHGHERYLPQAYYTMTSINVVCLVVTLVAAIYLLRLRHRGLIICNFLFGFQTGYFFLASTIGGGPLGSTWYSELGRSMAAAGA